MLIDIEDLNLIANKLARDFAFFKNKKIFLTGGTGFFGKWILTAIKFLNEKYNLNASVTILTRDPTLFYKTNQKLYLYTGFKFICGDIASLKIDDDKYDLIIHAAADVSDRGNSRLENIMLGVEKITTFANASECKRLIFISSGAVYGSQPNALFGFSESFTNNSKINANNNVYALGKKSAENYFIKHLNAELVIARCFAFAGPYLPLDGKFAFGNFVANFIKDEDIVISGDGKAVRSYLYSADLVVWLLTILARGKNREIYNVGSSECLSIKDLAVKMYGSENRVILMNQTCDMDNVYYPNVDRAKKELGLDIYTSIDLTIKKTIEFYKFNKNN